MMCKESRFALLLSLLTAKYRNTIYPLLDDYTFEELWSRIKNENLQTMPHIARVYSRDPLTSAELITQKLPVSGFRMVALGSRGYPGLLAQIPRPPLVLYVHGTIALGPSVSIVGTRNSSLASDHAVRELARRLTGDGFTVISGMAKGIDRAAHLGALEAKGPTVGVLACGPGLEYPRSNHDLFELIRHDPQKSALVSEYPPGTPAYKWSFVQRNRIISGLSQATVVAQAAKRSGAMITARYALEQGRELFSFGSLPFDSSCEGNLSLINQGGMCIYDETTIYEALGYLFDSRKKIRSEEREDIPSEWAAVLHLMRASGAQFDQLVDKSGLSVSKLNQILLAMELDGRIIREGDHIREKL